MALRRIKSNYSRYGGGSRFSLNGSARLVRVALIGGLVAAVLGLGVLLIVYIDFATDGERIDQSIAEYKAWLHGIGTRPEKPPIKIFAKDGKTLIGEYLPERGSRVNLAQCGKMDWLQKAVVAAEDRDFFDHGGVSYRGIFRAFINNLLSFSFREGGGSITQQLARNLFTDRRATLYRKLYETFVAFQLEEQLDKKEILCLYLNKIYMGEGRIGAEEASWFYFRKPPWTLDAAEAAMIVGLFPSPVRYSPLNNIEASLRKQDVVLQAMIERGDFKAEDRDKTLKAFFKKYDVSTAKNAYDPGLIGLYGASRDFRVNLAPSANEYVRTFLYGNFDEALVREGGLSVVTTIDPVRQRAGMDAVRGRVEETRAALRKNQKVDPEKMERIARRLNGVLVSIDARTGNIHAVVGGSEITEGNMTARVWEMRRQPGSSIKGFLYAAGLDEGVIEAGQEVEDAKIDFDGYSPRNWYRDFKGVMTLRSAVAQSVNTVAVKVLDDLGVDRFRKKIADALQLDYFDGRQRFPGTLSLALGSGEVTPLELARLYAVLLNDGRSVLPRLILKVTSPDNRVIWEDEELPESDQVFSPQACAGALYLLSGVTQDPEGTMGWVGRRQRQSAKFLPFDVAGKSGTVQSVAAHFKKFPHMYGAHDAWYVGLVPGEATVVWVGHDEGAPFPGSGAGVAGMIWSAYAQAGLPGRVSGSFPAFEVRPPVDVTDSPAGDLLKNYQDDTPIVDHPEPGPEVAPPGKTEPPQGPAQGPGVPMPGGIVPPGKPPVATKPAPVEGPAQVEKPIVQPVPPLKKEEKIALPPDLPPTAAP